MEDGATMSLPIPPGLETKIRAPAEAEGLSIEACRERLVHAERQGMGRIASAGAPRPRFWCSDRMGPSYWQEKHGRLDEGLKETETR